MRELAKELLGLSGEFAVASELCRRGMYAQLTLGTHKRTDILVETDRKMLRIQVKAKQSNEWPAIKGIFEPNEFLVLVDFAGKAKSTRPDFYVLSLHDWKALVRDEKRKWPKDVKVDKRYRLKYSDGYEGFNLKPGLVTKHRERWEKILSRVGPRF